MADEAEHESQHFDGHDYAVKSDFDLQNPIEQFSFQKQLGMFMDMFDAADEVYADDGGHRHFRWDQWNVKCDIEQKSKRHRSIYWTMEKRNND